ncbi:MAG: hypothetical protein ACMUEM_07105 [Flavobacteriales bacterium AspAUS03]
MPTKSATPLALGYGLPSRMKTKSRGKEKIVVINHIIKTLSPTYWIAKLGSINKPAHNTILIIKIMP